MFRLPSENRLIVFISEIRADDVRSGGLDREHDRCEVLALVWVTLIDGDLASKLADCGSQEVVAARAESVGGVDERPVLLAEGLPPVGGDHPAGITIVRPKADHPRIAHFCERRIGAAEAKRLRSLEDVTRDRVILRRTNRAEEGNDVGLRRKLGKGEHRAGIRRLVVLGDKFELLSQNTAGFIDAIQCDLGARERISSHGGRRPGDRKDHSDLERFRCASNAREHRRRKARCEPCI